MVGWVIAFVLVCSLSGAIGMHITGDESGATAPVSVLADVAARDGSQKNSQVSDPMNMQTAPDKPRVDINGNLPPDMKHKTLTDIWKKEVRLLSE